MRITYSSSSFSFQYMEFDIWSYTHTTIFTMPLTKSLKPSRTIWGIFSFIPFVFFSLFREKKVVYEFGIKFEKKKLKNEKLDFRTKAGIEMAKIERNRY